MLENKVRELKQQKSTQKINESANQNKFKVKTKTKTQKKTSLACPKKFKPIDYFIDENSIDIEYFDEDTATAEKSLVVQKPSELPKKSQEENNTGHSTDDHGESSMNACPPAPVQKTKQNLTQSKFYLNLASKPSTSAGNVLMTSNRSPVKQKASPLLTTTERKKSRTSVSTSQSDQQENDDVGSSMVARQSAPNISKNAGNAIQPLGFNGDEESSLTKSTQPATMLPNQKEVSNPQLIVTSPMRSLRKESATIPKQNESRKRANTSKDENAAKKTKGTAYHGYALRKRK